MRLVGVVTVALVAGAACSGPASSTHADASAADVPVDACPPPHAASDCVENGFGTLSPDGQWHMTGTATTTVISSTGTTMAMGTIDRQVFVQRYGCVAGFGTVAMPPADPRTAVSATAISFACDHSAGCARGASHWSICVHADGQLVYQESTYSTSTMPSAYETIYDVTAVLMP